jgi:cysteine synthase A
MLSHVLEAVGRTPLIELTRVVPEGHARVVAKLEGQNPTGSLKDRMATAVVDGALRSGQLSTDGTLVEYTGGSTGTSLAFVCAARGIRSTMVTSDAFSLEKRDHMRALGAEVVEIPSDNGKLTRDLIEAMMARAAELSEGPRCFYADQFNNPHAAGGYHSLAEEAWEQSNSNIDVFVHSVGTAHSLAGIAEILTSRNPALEVVAVEPAESAVLSGGESGAHRIEGIGPGFVPPKWSDGLADRIAPVRSDDAMAMSRRLAKEEGIFAGTSAGANVIAAVREAARLGPGHTVCTVLCDSGLKYLSTELYKTG